MSVVEVDLAHFTEWALLQRGYIVRDLVDYAGWQKEGWYEWIREGVEPGGHDTSHLDEYGFNNVIQVPIGFGVPSWVTQNWKRGFPHLYAWYMNKNEWRPYKENGILFMKNDVYIHTEEV